MNKNLFKLMEIKMKLVKIRKEEELLEKQIEKIRQGCEHEIIITTCKHDSKVIKGLVAYPKTTCLFCEEFLGPKMNWTKEEQDKMNKAVEINFNKFPKLFKKWHGKWGIQLRKLYNEVRKENSSLSEYDIGNIMIDRMKKMENEIPQDEKNDKHFTKQEEEI